MSLEMNDLFAKQMLNINGQPVNLDAIDITDIQEILGPDTSLYPPPYIHTSEPGKYSIERNVIYNLKNQLTSYRI